MVAETLGHVLEDGPAWSLRQLLRLAMALKAGFAEVIETALTEHHQQSQPAQWEVLQNILTEAELSLEDPAPTPHRPKRLSRPHPHPRGGLTIRREWLPNGWRLRLHRPRGAGDDDRERVRGGGADVFRGGGGVEGGELLEFRVYLSKVLELSLQCGIGTKTLVC